MKTVNWSDSSPLRWSTLFNSPISLVNHKQNSPEKRLSSNKSLKKGHFWGQKNYWTRSKWKIVYRSGVFCTMPSYNKAWDYSSDSSPPVLQYMAYQAGQPVVYGGWRSPSAKVGCLFHFPKSLLHLFLLLLNYCLCKRSLPVLEKSSVICFIAATQPIALAVRLFLKAL